MAGWSPWAEPATRRRIDVRIAILTFEGFNELDSLVAFNILNRAKLPGCQVLIAAPAPRVRSMNGLVIDAQATVQEACQADAVVVGSGASTRALLEDQALLDSLRLDPTRQLIASQCSGALLLAKLGLLDGLPACTDLATKPWLEKAGVTVLDRAFVAHGNLATTGGCLASQYLSAWMLARLAGIAAAMEALRYVAPVGEKDQYVGRMLENIRPYLPAVGASAS